MSKYYYHGIRNISDVNTVLEIFKSGGIKSKRMQNRSYKIGFNGVDYVSVCNKVSGEEYKNFSNNAFKKYIINRFCFIIDDTITAVRPKFIGDAINWNRIQLIKLITSDSNIRFTDMIDEWQIKDEIPLSYIIGIGIPVKEINNFLSLHQENAIKRNIRKIIDAIIEYAINLNLDIVDSSNDSFIEEYESKKNRSQKKLNLRK